MVDSRRIVDVTTTTLVVAVLQPLLNAPSTSHGTQNVVYAYLECSYEALGTAPEEGSSSRCNQRGPYPRRIGWHGREHT
jgi:hypothetical protein